MNRRKQKAQADIKRSANHRRKSNDRHMESTATAVTVSVPSPSLPPSSWPAAIADDHRPGRSTIESIGEDHKSEISAMPVPNACDARIASSNGARLPPLTSEIDPGEAQEARSDLTTRVRLPGDEIRVGAGGNLVVPREDFGGEVDEGVELDLAGLVAQKIRKPARREWVALDPTSELTTRMLQHKPDPEGVEVEHYSEGEAIVPTAHAATVCLARASAWGWR